MFEVRGVMNMNEKKEIPGGGMLNSEPKRRQAKRRKMKREEMKLKKWWLAF